MWLRVAIPHLDSAFVGVSKLFQQEHTPNPAHKEVTGMGELFCEAIERVKSYENPDSRCTYPFALDALGYCWSYANHVDGTSGFEDMEKICPTCDEWSGEADHE